MKRGLAPWSVCSSFGNHPALRFPGAGGITDGLEETHFLAQRLGTLGSHGSFDIHLFQQAGVLGDSHHVTHLVTVTPVQHADQKLSTAEDDLHLRRLAEPLHQQGQNRPRQIGAILAGRRFTSNCWPQDIQVQETVAVVVTMNETLLVAVHHHRWHRSRESTCGVTSCEKR